MLEKEIGAFAKVVGGEVGPGEVGEGVVESEETINEEDKEEWMDGMCGMNECNNLRGFMYVWWLNFVNNFQIKIK